ncbi:MAG: hypothetical protein ACI8YQ_002393 [Polaribacter sp.]|jgi:hypothetical protein
MLITELSWFNPLYGKMVPKKKENPSPEITAQNTASVESLPLFNHLII